MRAEVTSKYKRLSVLAAALFVIAGLGMVSEKIMAQIDFAPGEVKVSKSIEPVAGKINTWKLTLGVKARDNADTTSDTILIIDRSGSMANNSRMANVKTAAKKFVDEVVRKNNANAQNRMAIISYSSKYGSAEEVTVHGGDSKSDKVFSAQASTLDGYINSLVANGGTHTQSALYQARNLIAHSHADLKNIIVLSDGEPTQSFLPNNATSNLSDQTAEIKAYGKYSYGTSNTYSIQSNDKTKRSATTTGLTYDYTQNAGTGYAMYHRIGGSGNNTFYHTGNAARDEANFIKNANLRHAGENDANKATVYSVAFGAGDAGEAVLKDIATKSAGDKYYFEAGDGDASSLTPIFTAIAGDIGAPARDISIEDVMSDQFVAIEGTASANGVLSQANKLATWSGVSLGAPDANGIRTGSVEVEITLDESYQNFASDAQNGVHLYDTNKTATFTYTKPDGEPGTQQASSPRVNPVLIHTKKVLNGQKAHEDDQYTIAVTNGADYGHTFTASGSYTSPLAVATGTYIVSESISGGGQYDTEYLIESAIGNPPLDLNSDNRSFELARNYQKTTDAMNSHNDIYITVTNTAKKGSLVIEKKLGDCTAETPATSSGDKSFTFKVSGPVEKEITLQTSKANCYVSDTLSDLPQGEYTITEQGAGEYTTTNTGGTGKVGTVTIGYTTGSSLAQRITFTNKHTATRDITVQKTWTGGNLDDHQASFTLYQNGVKVSDKTIRGEGSITWSNLAKADSFGDTYTYIIKETNLPANYTSSLPENGSVVTGENVNVTNTYTAPTITIPVKKIWQGGENFHKPIEVALTREGDSTFRQAATLQDDTQWQHSFSVPKTDQNGAAYRYHLEEVTQLAEFTQKITGDQATGFAVTNTYTVPTTSVTARKVWQGTDGQPARPTIELQLLQNGSAFKKPQQLADGTTEATWRDVPKTDTAGNLYTYTVRETTELYNYTTSYSDDTFTITNTAKKGSLTIEKKLGDCKLTAPTNSAGDKTFTFTISGASEQEVSIKVSKDNCYAYVVVPNLQQGEYTITEQGAEKYKTSYSVDGSMHTTSGKQATVRIGGQEGALSKSLTFTNTYEHTQSISATKQWKGGNASDHTVTLELWRDGIYLEGHDKIVDGNATTTWDVPSADIYGNTYSYSVKEANMPANYTGACFKQANSTGCPISSSGSTTITNTYVSPKTTFTATKEWIGGPSERPTIELQLYRNGQAYGDAVTLASGVTSHTWKNLDQTDADGNAYTYTVDEVAVPANYTKSQNGSTITNTYVSPKTTFTATKEWVGGPSERPTIELQLYRNGQAYGDAVTLSTGQTSYTWSDLDQTSNNGTAYTYTVDEVAVPANYTKSQNGSTITNTYVSPKIDVTASKQWVDGPSEHPTIELQLYRNDSPYGEAVSLANGQTSYTWKALDATDANGQKYTYRVNEVAVPDTYEASYSQDGLTVTNTYVIPTDGEVTANKIWVNGPEARPTVEFKLYRHIANDERSPVNIETKQLVNGTTTATWTGLERTDKYGNEYIFTVEEVAVPQNYQASISSDGLTITNTYQPPMDQTATAHKVWVNGPDEHPTIWLKLYRSLGDGEREAVDVSLKELPHGVTTATWSGLQRTDLQGKEYRYSVEEVDSTGASAAPANYQATYSEDSLTVTNTYVSPKTSYTVHKIWLNGPSVRPDISIQLYANGHAYGAPVTLRNGTTSYTWTDLDKTDQTGNIIAYTVDELRVPEHYKKHVDANRITNEYIYTPGKGSGDSGAGLPPALTGTPVQTPVVPLSSPGKLPTSGAETTVNPLLALLAGLLTYIGAFFIQQRYRTEEQ